MRVLVCGGRDFTDWDYVDQTLGQIHRKLHITQVIEGGAPGADRLGRRWANENAISLLTFDADWDRYGNRAGPVRNCKMLREGNPELVVAFKGGTGTRHMVGIAEEAGVRVLRRFDNEARGIRIG